MSCQLAITLPVQAIRIGFQYAFTPYASSSMDVLNNALILGEFAFTIALACYNYLNLQQAATALFVISILLTFIPTAITLVYECINQILLWRDKKTALALQASDNSKKLKRSTMTHLTADDIIPVTEIADWF